MSYVTHDKTDKQPTRKHIAERQRRARINHLLEQLESIISPSDKKNGNPVKLEKAEVLERTLEYVKRLKCASPDSASTYVYGYMKCMGSIGQYLKEASTPQTVVHSLQSYLVSNINKDDLPSLAHSEMNNNETMFSGKHEFGHASYSGDVVQPINIHNEDTISNGRDFQPEKSTGPFSQNCDEYKLPVWRPW